jgi:hypothetical protein
MEIDYTGSASVAEIIENSSFTKFLITRIGANRNYAPIFESEKVSSPTILAEKFRNWARITDNCNPYDLTLTKSDSFEELETTEGKMKKAPNKLLKFSFRLKAEDLKPKGESQNHNISDIVNMALEKQALVYQNNDIMKELASLRAKIEEEEEEEEDEEMEEVNGTTQNLINILSPYLGALLKQPSIINDASDTTTEALTLKSVINRLHKVDKDILSDLSILADIAEKKPELFKMLLNQLRGMK